MASDPAGDVDRILAVGQVDVPGLHADGPPHPLEVAEGPAVDVVADDDLVVRPGQLREGRCRRGARREGDPEPAALQGRNGAFEALPRGFCVLAYS